MAWVVSFLARYDAVDRLLVAHGFPATSPWWRARIERFLASGKRRWVLRVGRRGGKSSTLCRLFTCWLLWGPWVVPPGDTGVIAIVSVNMKEARQRLFTIEELMRTLGVRYERRGDEVFVAERAAKFSVFACSTTATVGFTSIGIWCDEQAKWTSDDKAANPAKEVLASLRPTMATVRAAIEVDCSAPWGTDDHHAKMCSDGDTDEQNYDFAETWVANPSPEVAEEETRKLEPDVREWSRAYAAIPSETIEGDFFGAGLDMALVQPRVAEPRLPWVRYWVSIDPAFDRDHFGWSVCSSRSMPPDARYPDKERRLTRIHATGAWKIDKRSPLDMAFRLRDEVCRKYQSGTELYRVISDQYEGHSFAELGRQAGILIQIVPWTAGSSETAQIARYRAVRIAMLEGSLLLPDDPTLVSELRAVRKVLLPSGNERIELPRNRAGGHLDRVSAMVLGASEAMSALAQPEENPKPVAKVEGAWREKARREVLEKRQREWERNPTLAMRRAMGVSR